MNALLTGQGLDMKDDDDKKKIDLAFDPDEGDAAA